MGVLLYIDYVGGYTVLYSDRNSSQSTLKIKEFIEYK